MPNGLSLRPRAGFWRRCAALLCDAIIITVPLQLLFAGLYVVTDGAVQAAGLFSRCQTLRDVSQLPEGLNPPPPAGSNFARLCQANNFGVEVGRWLVVRRVTKEGNVTKSTSRRYDIGRDGKIINANRVDWLITVALFIYLVMLEWRFGATLGKRLLRTRVLDVAHPAPGIPMRKAVLRNLLIPGG